MVEEGGWCESCARRHVKNLQALSPRMSTQAEFQLGPNERVANEIKICARGAIVQAPLEPPEHAPEIARVMLVGCSRFQGMIPLHLSKHFCRRYRFKEMLCVSRPVVHVYSILLLARNHRGNRM